MMSRSAAMQIEGSLAPHGNADIDRESCTNAVGASVDQRLNLFAVRLICHSEYELTHTYYE
jgi:hypothetical protein